MDQRVKQEMIVKEYMPLKKGMTLLEVAIGLALLALAGSIVAPSFLRQIARYERNKCLSDLDAIAAQAWLHTLQTGLLHRIKFNLAAGAIVVEQQKYSSEGELVYEKVPLYFSNKDFILPKDYNIENFYIDGIDECAQHGAGRTMEDVWFYLYPQGYTQAVIINMLNMRAANKGTSGEEIGLVLNPFRMQFEVYDAFQKP